MATNNAQNTSTLGFTISVRDLVKQSKIKVEFLETGKMVADSLTKSVNKQKNDFCAKSMGLVQGT